MPRREFPTVVVESVLIKSRRHCSICDGFCGSKIQIHHIASNEDNSEDNAIPLCLTCHAEVKAYNPSHPIGRPFTESELKKLRQITYDKYAASSSRPVPTGTDYSLGFHDGVQWSDKRHALEDGWRVISTFGDFAIEISLYFDTEDSHTMMDDWLFSDDIETGLSISQTDGHRSAWSAGVSAGFWDVNGDTELLFLTEKGKVFRSIVMNTPELRSRFSQLRQFWNTPSEARASSKPAMLLPALQHDFSPGAMNALSTQIDRLVRFSSDQRSTYVVKEVTPSTLILGNLDSGENVTLDATQVIDVHVDQETGLILLESAPLGRSPDRS